MLFIRSGNNDELVKAGLEATLAKLGIREHPAVRALLLLWSFASPATLLLFVPLSCWLPTACQWAELKRCFGLQRASQVSFVPRVSAANYPKLFRTADAFVLPTHGEAWGRPLAEAMFMEMPTIATQWSGQLEFMNDDNSFLVPPSGLEPAYPDDPEMRGRRLSVPPRV